MTRLCSIGAMIVILASPLRAETFIIDPAHSTVSFKVKGPLGKVNGKFEKFAGRFDYEAQQPQKWSASATIETESIRTGIGRRDSDLKKADFLDVKTYPVMTFTSTSAAQSPAEKATISGNLTLHGVTRPVTLVLESVEALSGTSAPQSLHAVATARIERGDFGVGLSHGTFLVGKTIDIRLDILGTTQPNP